MKRILLLIILISITNIITATKHDHHDEHEVRYVENHKSLNEIVQYNLRNQKNWNDFLALYPNWHVYFDEYSLKPHRAFGDPISLNGSSVEQKVINFTYNQLFDFNIPNDIRFKAKRINDKHINLDFVQYYNQLEVINSRLFAKLTLNEELIVFGLDLFSDITTDVVPTIDIENAVLSATQHIHSDISDILVDDDLRILPVPNHNKYEYHLVYTINFKTRINHGPANYMCYVDAHSGDLLMRINKVMYETPPPPVVNVSGELYTTHPYNPSSIENLINLKSVHNNTNYYTDNSGNVNIPSNSGNVTYYLDGRFAEVRTNSYIPNFTTSVTNTNVSFDNSNSTIQERTAYRAANMIHDHFVAQFPTFTGLNFPMETNIDEAGSCNAYFDGSSINFYAEGGGCHATAKIPDVVYHEYGHAINSWRYGSGMWNGGLNEGFADVWAISLTESAVLGYGWDLVDPTIFVRRYDQDLKVYPQDLVGQVHADGEIIAGAFWDTYLNLGNMQQMLDLFKYTYDGAPDGPNGTEGIIYTDILVEVLYADDNDANLNNGTPNDAAIIQAFALHGITLLSDAVINHNPITVAPGNTDVTINANISVTYPWALSSASCYYRVNNATNWNTVPMIASGNNFSAIIPSQPNGTIVAYYISLVDNYGNESGVTPIAANLTPLNNANLPYFMMIGYELVQEEDFDFNIGFWQTGDPSDNATTGIWEIGDPLGSYDDPQSQSGMVQTEDQHTLGGFACAFTQNASSIFDGLGDSDVDGGHTTLYSPYYNLSSYTNPAFSYWRWYTNSPPSGANPGADWWQVLITDDGVNWVYVENNKTSDMSWRNFSFRVKDYVSLSNSVQLKFIASDSTRLGQYLDGGSLVEAAIDDLYLHEAKLSTTSNENLQEFIEPKLIKITDLLGREVDVSNIHKYNALLYIYDNGNIEKKFKLLY